MEHVQPLLSVDSVIMRLTKSGLEVLLAERWNEPFAGSYALPGVLLNSSESLAEAAVRAVEDKTDIPAHNVRGVAQLKAFDATNRDPRGSTISMTCWTFVDPNTETSGSWTPVSEIDDLPFDHMNILHTALHLLENPSKTLVWGILGEKFSSGDYALLIESAGGQVDRTNLTRIIPSRIPEAVGVGLEVSKLTQKKGTHWEIPNPELENI